MGAGAVTSGAGYQIIVGVFVCFVCVFVCFACVCVFVCVLFVFFAIFLCFFACVGRGEDVHAKWERAVTSGSGCQIIDRADLFADSQFLGRLINKTCTRLACLPACLPLTQVARHLTKACFGTYVFAQC